MNRQAAGFAGNALRKKRFAAFTLVEMLIVIIIVVILAALLFPAAMAMRNRAAKAKTQAVLKKVEAAIRQYSNDQGAYPFMGGRADGSQTRTLYDAWLDGDQLPTNQAWTRPQENARLLYDLLNNIYLKAGDVASTMSDSGTVYVGTQNPGAFYVDSWGKPLIYIYVHGNSTTPPADRGIRCGGAKTVLPDNKYNYGRPWGPSAGQPNDSTKEDAPEPKPGYLHEFELWSGGPDKKFAKCRGGTGDKDNVEGTIHE